MKEKENITRREPISIIGISCRFPGNAHSPQQFWELLCEGVDAIREVPPERWHHEAFYSANPQSPGKTVTRHGGFLQNIDEFDPTFFGISPREAAFIDPQQRLLLELAHEAFEDAGIRWQSLQARNTGVFVGIFIHDYQHILLRDRTTLGAHTGTGVAMSLAANRISYCFNFQGPSVALDTACSSSLVAVDQACKALRNNDCDYAIAGGVNVILGPDNTIAMSKANMLSEDGRCKAFDARANGYVRSEGAGLVLLQRQTKAIQQNNNRYADLLGVGVNSDGKSKGISVPNGEAQARLIRQVLAESQLDPKHIDYVEAHGTGTPVGDPIEANAIGQALCDQREDACLLGSVKTNIGHLESASGVAGLIKVALCLKHRAIPPNLHFQQPNPDIDFAKLKLQVVTEMTPWHQRDKPRRASLNSFGFGGTNAHAILEEATISETAKQREPTPLPQTPWVFPWGAHDPTALKTLAMNYANILTQHPERAGDLAYTVSQCRGSGAHRAALVAHDVETLTLDLKRVAQGEPCARFHQANALIDGAEKPVFVFSGMGTQWAGMAQQLYRSEAVFKETLQRIDQHFTPLAGWSIVDKLLSCEANSVSINQTQIAQPTLFAVQAGLADWLRDLGVQPVATLGHSVGAAAALYTAGALSLAQATTIIYHRSTLQATTAGSGSMLAVELSKSDAAEWIRPFGDAVSIAAINSPTALTLSGSTPVLQQLLTQLTEHGIFARTLKVEIPYHSPMMEALREDLCAALRDIEPNPLQCDYFSTADGVRMAAQTPVGDANYWWRNIRQPVLFAPAVSLAIQQGHRFFVEVGAHPVLQGYLKQLQQQAHAEGVNISTLKRQEDEHRRMAETLAQLHTHGVDIDWSKRLATGNRLSLPLYPWQRKRHWSESPHWRRHRIGDIQAERSALGESMSTPQGSWSKTLSLVDNDYLVDHKIQGQAVFPGTGYLEMALQTLLQQHTLDDLFATGHVLWLQQVEIERALYLNDVVKLHTQLEGVSWQIHSENSPGNWVRHARGRALSEKLNVHAKPVSLAHIIERCPWEISSDYCYRLFRDVGLEYGPAFQAIRSLRYGNGEALAHLSLPSILATDDHHDFIFHPALMDACLHTLFGALNLNGEDSHRRGNVFLPVSIDQLKLYRQPPTELVSHAIIVTRSDQYFDANITIYTAEGKQVLSATGLRCQALAHPTEIQQQRQRQWLLEYEWQPTIAPTTIAPTTIAPTHEQPDSTGHWLVIADDNSSALQAALNQRGVSYTLATHSMLMWQGDYHSLDLSIEADWLWLLRLLAERDASAPPLLGVLHAAALAPQSASPIEWQQQIIGAGSLLMLCRALDTLKHEWETQQAD
ncbi:MAG: type I polyketide synthase, partial [Gammaproteobacteria bacterium]